MNHILMIKSAALSVLALLLSAFGLIAPSAIVLAVVMAMDYITGVMAAVIYKKNHAADPNAGISSRNGMLGIFKKIGYLFGIGIGLCLDWMVYTTADQFNLGFKTGTFFGLLICVWFILNEILSIIENLDEIGVTLPSFVMKVVQLLKRRVEAQGDGGGE